MAHSPRNLRHRTRTAANVRYPLRGQPPHAAIALHTTATQRTKNAIATRIQKDWPITRIGRRSRGLRRVGNTCFRLSGLQALLHLPKFLHWILSHNTMRPDGTVQFPCRNNLKDVGMIILAKFNAECDERPPKKLALPQCPACVVKHFIQAYWGVGNVDANGAPRVWAHGHPEMGRLRNLDQRIRIATAGAANDAQEDLAEFQDLLLEACLASTNYTVPGDEAWLDNFNALFIIEYNVEWRCECSALQPLAAATSRESIGIDNLSILPNGTADSVKAALTRESTPEVLGDFDCATCRHRRPRTQVKRIDGAPDLLRIKISDLTSTGARNNNPIRINPTIDLGTWADVPQLPAPLKYKLNSVLCHGGGITAGHWTATVTDPGGVNESNDHTVVATNQAGLRANPQHGRQAIVLTYTRVYPRS
ncbi:cysteine proteinase [Setomelanomma holmii]|uniref:ubiquitinyl hydrolase 1 n=1 Tax=Setomelanomma holmii TaxID=210430 RepID=A0A9P4HDB4_9PLEO|nr:cysteine proteinase [Setomelanomma holmii]